jgi:hypothetical protein
MRLNISVRGVASPNCPTKIKAYDAAGIIPSGAFWSRRDRNDEDGVFARRESLGKMHDSILATPRL